MTTMTKSQTVRGTKQSMAGTMKAVVIRGFGGPDVLEPTEVPVAEPQPGHLLIKVNAAGLNRLDHSIRQGEIAPELPWPHILGADAAGEVAAIGAGVTGFEIGDAVIPMPGYPLDEDEWAGRHGRQLHAPGVGSAGHVRAVHRVSGRVHRKRPDRAIAGARGDTAHGLGDRSPVRKDRRWREVG